MSTLPDPRRVVVVGGGMVAHRFVESLVTRLDDALDAGDVGPAVHVTVLAEEPRAPYDRVHLTSYFDGRDPAALTLGDPGLWERPGVLLRRGEQVVSVDRTARTVRTAPAHGSAGAGVTRTYPYDDLVLATGSSAFVPPVEGKDLPGCFVYRTLDDVAALRQYVETLRADASAQPDRAVRGAVVGGGLLGLEAAGALRALGAC